MVPSPVRQSWKCLRAHACRVEKVRLDSSLLAHSCRAQHKRLQAGCERQAIDEAADLRIDEAPLNIACERSCRSQLYAHQCDGCDRAIRQRGTTESSPRRGSEFGQADSLSVNEVRATC